MKKEVMMFVVGFLFLLNFVLAADTGYCVISEITSINPSSVGADEDFTVGIEIDNCGEKLPENIIFEITRHSQDINVKEPLINYVGKMGYTNSKRFILYHMHSSKDITPGEHIFETKLSYGDKDFILEKKDSFSITANIQEPDVTVSRIYTTPEIIYDDEKIILTIDIENSGKGQAKDVRVELEDLGLQGIKQKYLGQIGPDENIPARFVFENANGGLYQGNIKVNYKVGGGIEELEFPLQVQIFAREVNKLWFYIIIPVIVFLTYFLFRKKTKSKR